MVRGHSEFCEDHIWLWGKVRLCQWAAYLLVIVNVGAMAASLYVSPVILIAVIYIKVTIQQTLALTWRLGKGVKRLFRSVCSASTIPKYRRLDIKEEDYLP